MSSEGYHEPYDQLTPEARDLHRAIESLKEELDAINWYHQRIEVTADPQLKAILTHNRDEEKEHAAMVLEWLRRRDVVLAENLGRYLFTEGEITAIEEKAENQPASVEAPTDPAVETEAATEASTPLQESPVHYTVGPLRKP